METSLQVDEAAIAKLKHAGTGFGKHPVFIRARYMLTKLVVFQHSQESCFLEARPSVPHLPAMSTSGSLVRARHGEAMGKKTLCQKSS